MSDATEDLTIPIRPWPQAAGPRQGTSPQSPYVDHYWMPLLGPTATSLARLLVRIVQQDPSTTHLPVGQLAASLGLDGRDAGRTVDAALERLRQEGITAVTESGVVLIGNVLPYLSPSQEARLPDGVQADHRAAFGQVHPAYGEGAGPAPRPSARLLGLAATVDELLTNPELRPRQLAYRFQHVVRLAEEARDEALLDWAAPDVETTLAECQLSGQAVSDAIWVAQHAVASNGRLPESSRAGLNDAAAGLVDWVVAEFPPESDAWVLDDHDL
ncbi:MAG TPA: hypothetical protein VHK88_02770 [Aquihabitans sp.]|jgi:hypothetical protein|nr:hypothetical protein [Aquihabitans sp.]